MDIEKFIAPVMDALDGLAADSDVPMADYIEALEQIEHSVHVSLEAARLDLGRTR